MIQKTNNTKTNNNTHPSNPVIQSKRQLTMLLNNTGPGSASVKEKRAATMKINDSHAFRKNNPNNTKITCPHCGLTGSKPGIIRWHGNRCKMLAKN